MEEIEVKDVTVEHLELPSRHLRRNVIIDIYQGDTDSEICDLLLVNDGQDLEKMDFRNILRSRHLKPLIVAAIHCGADRKNEYGVSHSADYKGWGAKAGAYEKFIVSELIIFLRERFRNYTFTSISFAGFSLGALSAFDIAWRNPDIFSMAAAFSGSFWWRSVDQNDKDYDPWKHRILHSLLKESTYVKNFRFFFECGEYDESEDRNKNGVIDSIDDTVDLMRLLIRKGYREGKDILYLQMPDGRHDVPSWAKAFPTFLEWAYGY